MALKIVVGAREQGTGNREQGTGFGQLYFSLIMSVFSSHLLINLKIRRFICIENKCRSKR
ncbi:MAG: hypothetical protein ACK5S7_10755 [Dolichospermum sp.]